MILVRFLLAAVLAFGAGSVWAQDGQGPAAPVIGITGTPGNIVSIGPSGTAGDSGTALSTLAPLASPALTGAPTAPTPSAADNSTKIATTAFVEAAFAAEFGSGVDGAVTISGSSSGCPGTQVGNTCTLTSDMNATNLTIVSPGVLVTAGYRVFVSQTEDISLAGSGAVICQPTANGGNASGATGGSGGNNGLTYRMLPPAPGGGTGATATTGTGPAGSGNATGLGFIEGGNGGPAGTGGTSGSTTVGSAGGTNTSAPVAGAAFKLPPVTQPFVVWNSSTAALQMLAPSQSGPGGGAGGGDGINLGGGGGGGGEGGCMIYNAARVINRGTNTNTGIFAVTGPMGGNGGNAAAGTGAGGGGGGGGGGGFIDIVVNALLGSTIANAIDASGGAGGPGGNGVGAGKGGTGGTGGRSGNIQVLNLGTPAFAITTFNQPGTAGSTTSTATGGAGGAGAPLQASL